MRNILRTNHPSPSHCRADRSPSPALMMSFPICSVSLQHSLSQVFIHYMVMHNMFLVCALLLMHAVFLQAQATGCSDTTLSTGEPWHDSFMHTCNQIHEQSLCGFYGVKGRFEGKTAIEACCACGGGDRFTSCRMSNALRSEVDSASGQCTSVVCEAGYKLTRHEVIWVCLWDTGKKSSNSKHVGVTIALVIGFSLVAFFLAFLGVMVYLRRRARQQRPIQTVIVGIPCDGLDDVVYQQLPPPSLSSPPAHSENMSPPPVPSKDIP